jgi:excisionase family DNA binding protein
MLKTQTLLITPTGLASRLNLQRKEVQELVDGGKIPFVRLPNGAIRFEEQAVETWIQNLKKNKAAE